MTSIDPPCLTEGALTAVTTGGRYGTIEFVTTAAITDDQITLADGRRYRHGGNYAEIDGNPSTPDTRLVDPHSRIVIDAYARQMLRLFCDQAQQLVRVRQNESGAPVERMDAAAVRQALDELANQLYAARKEVDRRAGL